MLAYVAAGAIGVFLWTLGDDEPKAERSLPSVLPAPPSEPVEPSHVLAVDPPEPESSPAKPESIPIDPSPSPPTESASSKS